VNLSLFKACEIVGIPPNVWMVPNPIKIYEFFSVVRASGLQRDHSILDLGCGKGHWTLWLAHRCRRAVGVDASNKKIETARNFLRNSFLKRHVEFLCARFEEVDLPSSSLDRVYSFSVLEHIGNLDVVLCRVTKLLKPGGEFHASVDCLTSVKDQVLINKHKQDNSVIQYFTESSLREKFKNAGLRVIDISPILTSDFARREFEKRISKSYKQNLIRRFLLYRHFSYGDTKSDRHQGIMLVARGQKPNSKI